jgi:threonine synthase
MSMDWILECSSCAATRSPEGLPTVCECGRPWLVRYPHRTTEAGHRDDGEGRGMWRFRRFLPLMEGESPVSLGEGDTPLLPLTRTGRRLGLDALLIKDEAINPTGSFKCRGLSAAITRAVHQGASSFVIPTAGNAGVAAAAYGARAGVPVRVFAPTTTPPAILAQIVSYGGELVQLEGHIGHCGAAARAHAASTGAMDLSTLREPYRIEGKKTLGIELAHALAWTLPDVIVYPAGGGTGLIGMWKAFQELAAAGWISGKLPRMFAVQSSGCAPIVKAFLEGAATAEPWADPWTVASGLRVPGPLGDQLMLAALKESSGGAVMVTDEELVREAASVSAEEGIDMSPEGGATIAAAVQLHRTGIISSDVTVVVFNTGAGWLYRKPADLLGL